MNIYVNLPRREKRLFSDSVVTEILGHGQTDRRTDRPQAFLYYKYTPWSIPD